MTSASWETDVSELADLLPLFPLPNVVLFPSVDLPLHIFEPRYRAMVRDSMASSKLIGMVLLRGDWRSSYYESPEIFGLGCAGRIEKFLPEPDGRSNLILHGFRRFRILEEVPGTSYRRARVDWLPEETEGQVDSDMEARLRFAVERLLRGSSATAAVDEVWDRLPREPERRINTLAFGLNLSVVERQALLECDGLTTRAGRLADILEFRVAELAAGPGVGEDAPRH